MILLKDKVNLPRPEATESLLRNGVMYGHGWERSEGFIPNEFNNFRVYLPTFYLIVRQDLADEIIAKVPGVAIQPEPVRRAFQFNPAEFTEEQRDLHFTDDGEYKLIDQLANCVPQHQYSRLIPTLLKGRDLLEITIEEPLQWATKRISIPIPPVAASFGPLIRLPTKGHLITQSLFEALAPDLDPPYWFAYDLQSSKILL